jgi:hypothetical protein
LKGYLIKNIRASFYLINNNKTKGKMGKITVSQALNIYGRYESKTERQGILEQHEPAHAFWEKTQPLVEE